MNEAQESAAQSEVAPEATPAPRVIPPTVGRKVWFYPTADSSGEPQDATVVAVHSDRLVNLVVFDHVGEMSAPRSVNLVQEGDEAPYGQHCRWMPYQLGQARR